MWEPSRSSGTIQESSQSRVLLADLAKRRNGVCENMPPCQKHANFHKAPPEDLISITTPWPFAKWGLDLLGPFPQGPGQVKYLIVGVDYFTKWIEAEPLATITAQKSRRFLYKNIVTRFEGSILYHHRQWHPIHRCMLQKVSGRLEHKTTIHFHRTSPSQWTSRSCQQSHIGWAKMEITRRKGSLGRGTPTSPMGISNNATFHHKGITLSISIRNRGNDPSGD